MKTYTSNDNFNELLFENRNQLYGAYDLRQSYEKTITQSLLMGSIIFILTATIPYLWDKAMPIKTIKEPTITTFCPTILPKESEILIPLKNIVTPPPSIRIKTIKIDIPEPKPDNMVSHETPPPSVDKINQTQIGTENTNGEIKNHFTSPTSLNNEKGKLTDIKSETNDEIQTTVDQPGEFPGGKKAMYDFINNKLEYPELAKNANIEGKVIVKFVIEKDGSLGNMTITKDIGMECGIAVIKTLRAMPKWKPAKKNGEPVRQYYSMPVDFMLDN